jgi:hypothetical protein
MKDVRLLIETDGSTVSVYEITASRQWDADLKPLCEKETLQGAVLSLEAKLLLNRTVDTLSTAERVLAKALTQ